MARFDGGEVYSEQQPPLLSPQKLVNNTKAGYHTVGLCSSLQIPKVLPKCLQTIPHFKFKRRQSGATHSG